jgi:hypothetical protein
MAVISMSSKELTRLHTLLDVAEDRIGLAEAADLMGVTRRQVSRLMRTFRADGGGLPRKIGTWAVLQGLLMTPFASGRLRQERTDDALRAEPSPWLANRPAPGPALR